MPRQVVLGFVVILWSVVASTAHSQQGAKIVIDKIEENSSISGHVTGLDKTTAKGYRVIVYVHTDVWYIHPYAGQGDGKSWAAIADDGSWSVETVKRDFPADSIAALIVGQGYDFPSRTANIDNVKNIGILKQRLRGTPDYGKL